MACSEARAHNLLEPNESTQERTNKSAITIGTVFAKCGEFSSTLLPLRREGETGELYTDLLWPPMAHHAAHLT